MIADTSLVRAVANREEPVSFQQRERSDPRLYRGRARKGDGRNVMIFGGTGGGWEGSDRGMADDVSDLSVGCERGWCAWRRAGMLAAMAEAQKPWYLRTSKRWQHLQSVPWNRLWL